MTVLIDNGHGAETPGKRSPDSRLLEWRWTRSLARRIAKALGQRGVDARLLVPEDIDVPLRERVARANSVIGAACVVSIHANASGCCAWMPARGWCALVAPNAGRRSRLLASMLASEAGMAGLEVRRPAPGLDYWEQSVAICRDTRCPAVLTENLFMDNRQDLDIMLSDSGIDAITHAHASALLKYIKSINDNRP